ncbi:hypothetical protein, partial [Mammaliicoccus sciuri]|uniref:hypothetical protein n=1 Tax=Mammaliicoccus sciuri TaxID=1296 RepID=UPI00195442D2
ELKLSGIARRIEWAHPSVGSYIATAGEAGCCIFKEVHSHFWSLVFEEAGNFTSIAWASPELSNWLAFGTDKGEVLIVKHLGNSAFRSASRFSVDEHVTALAWLNPQQSYFSPTRRLLSGSVNGEVKLTVFHDSSVSDELRIEQTVLMNLRSAVVRIASSMTQDAVALSCQGKVHLLSGTEFDHKQEIVLEGVEAQLSWSVLGSVLTVAQAPKTTLFFEQSASGEWIKSK